MGLIRDVHFQNSFHSFILEKLSVRNLSCLRRHRSPAGLKCNQSRLCLTPGGMSWMQLGELTVSMHRFHTVSAAWLSSRLHFHT